MIELILGGARSGKSTLAEQRAVASGLEVIYIATATAGDEEMAARIAHHQQQRPGAWSLLEEPRALAAVLEQHATAGHCLLVDCLTLWLSNLLGESDERCASEVEKLLRLLPSLEGEVILVSNEIGMGVVPMGELTRRFVDEVGRLHQQLATLCERVTLVAAGLPLALKDERGRCDV
jgi:adenosylcobinamide kinase/adenosylcobinamide-phosphate guanylyltransferase